MLCGAGIISGAYAGILIGIYLSIQRFAWLVLAIIGSIFLFVALAIFIRTYIQQQQPSNPALKEEGEKRSLISLFLNPIFAIITIECSIAVLCFTGVDMYYVKNTHIPDPPVLVAMAFVIIGLFFELDKPMTEWKVRKVMVPFALLSIFFAIWSIFTFNIYTNRYPGGPQNPFDAHFYQVFPIYSIFIGTFFFGFFPAFYFLVKPSANAVVGATIYNLLCLIIVPIGTALGFWHYPYIEDYIMEVLGLVMFVYWYKKATLDERKFLNRFNSLIVVLIVCVIATGMLALLVFSGIFKIAPGTFG